MEDRVRGPGGSSLPEPPIIWPGPHQPSGGDLIHMPLQASGPEKKTSFELMSARGKKKSKTDMYFPIRVIFFFFSIQHIANPQLPRVALSLPPMSIFFPNTKTNWQQGVKNPYDPSKPGGGPGQEPQSSPLLPLSQEPCHLAGSSQDIGKTCCKKRKKKKESEKSAELVGDDFS